MTFHNDIIGPILKLPISKLHKNITFTFSVSTDY